MCYLSLSLWDLYGTWAPTITLKNHKRDLLYVFMAIIYYHTCHYRCWSPSFAFLSLQQGCIFHIAPGSPQICLRVRSLQVTYERRVSRVPLVSLVLTAGGDLADSGAPFSAEDDAPCGRSSTLRSLPPQHRGGIRFKAYSNDRAIFLYHSPLHGLTCHKRLKKTRRDRCWSDAVSSLLLFVSECFLLCVRKTKPRLCMTGPPSWWKASHLVWWMYRKWIFW